MYINKSIILTLPIIILLLLGINSNSNEIEEPINKLIVREKKQSIRIVLSWGKKPKNLDAHLWFKDIHLFYNGINGRRSGLYSSIDRDDIDSYGPETLTISQVVAGEKYIYAVHDYTNKTNIHSKQLSFSDARIYIYKYYSNKPIKIYYIPRNKTGNIWFVFYIDERGDFIEINKFYSTNSDSGDILPILIENNQQK